MYPGTPDGVTMAPSARTDPAFVVTSAVTVTDVVDPISDTCP
jgi:hypothetical protein